MTRRAALLTLAIGMAVGLTSCASGSTVDGRPSANAAVRPTSPPTSAPNSVSPSVGTSPTSPTSSGTSNEAIHLGAQLGASLATTRTAHLRLAIDAGGQTIVANGVEQLHDGRLVALSLNETIPGFGELDLVIVGHQTYARVPSTLARAKPWLRVTAHSSDPVIQALSSTLSSTQQSASLETIVDFVGAASSIKNVGTSTVNGVMATQYAMVIDVAKLPADYPGKQTLGSAGIDTLPIRLFIDSQGRPVRLTEALSVQSQSVHTNIDITQYNAPVTITAPPANQIGH